MIVPFEQTEEKFGEQTEKKSGKAKQWSTPLWADKLIYLLQQAFYASILMPNNRS